MRDNLLTGNAGNNTLAGGAGDDRLRGAAGNDLLAGGSGLNVYAFGRGDGQDTVLRSSDPAARRLNLLALDAGIATGDVTLRRVLDTQIAKTEALELAIAGGTDKVTVNGFLAGDNPASISNGVQLVRFADGTAWDATTLQAMLASNPVSGTAGVDTLTGTAAADRLDGGAGNDTLDGGAGHDWIDGGAGADAMAGGAGNDLYVVDDAADRVSELAAGGDDTVRSAVDWTLGAEVENLVLTGTAVRGTGNALGNRLYGNAAANTLDGAAGADVMAGGLGNDRYVVDDAADGVFERPDEGVDTIESSIDWTLRADVENLTLTGTANLAATGNVLDNVLTGNAGANLLRGGLGNDTYVVNRLDDQILEVWGEGSDTVRSSVSWTLDYACDDLVLTGTAAIDGTGNEFANRLTGNAAANRLDGGVGADRMSGGAGDDTYVVNDVGDVVGESAGAGIDTVEASTASWVLSAAVDNLILVGAGSLQGFGNDLANRLTGNDNANLLSGGLGADTMIGGAGDDTYIVDNLGDTVVEAAGGGTDTVKSSVSWTLDAATENLTLTGAAAVSATGNAGANVLAGNTAANRLDGGAGADTMYGGAGDDTYVVDNAGDRLAEGAGNGIDTVEASVASWTLSAEVENLVLIGAAGLNGYGNSLANRLTGNANNNILNGAIGADTMIGGAGDDTYLVDNAGDTVAEAAVGGIDTVKSSITWALGSELEKLTLTGTAAIDGTGNALANTMWGSDAANAFFGGDGADSLTGQGGDDVLNGDGGDDTLSGGIGNDTLRGGAGNDIYRWGPGGGQDIVTDTGGTDRIEIAAGVIASQVTLLRSGNHLRIGIAGSTDTLTVTDWYTNAVNRIELIRLSDGTPLPAPADVSPSVAAATLGSDPAAMNRQQSGLVDAMAQFSAGSAPPLGGAFGAALRPMQTLFAMVEPIAA